MRSALFYPKIEIVDNIFRWFVGWRIRKEHEATSLVTTPVRRYDGLEKKLI